MAKKISIDQDEAKRLLDELNGVVVSHAWRGHGSAIFLELGELASMQSGKHDRGEQSIMIEWSWRVENEKTIILGSWDEDMEIDKFPELVKNRTIKSVEFFGNLSELEIQFSDNLRLSSFATTKGDPMWSIMLKNGSWLGVSEGEFHVERTI